MGFTVEIENGKPARVHVETIEELRELLGYGNVVKTRAVAARRTPRRKAPKSRGPNAATRKNSKPAGKTKKGTRGGGPEVFQLAKERNIRSSEARSILAKQKQAAKKKSA